MIFESIVKLGIQGASTAGGMLLFGNIRPNDTVPIFNVRFPVWAVAGVAGASSSIIADLVHPLIHEHIAVNKKFEEQTSMLSSALIAGATLTGVLYGLNSNFLSVTGATRMFMIGAGSEVAGAYVASIVEG